MSRGRHAASRRPPWRTALVILAVLAGTGVAGTWAYWADTATVLSGTIHAGSMDLQFDAGGPGFADGIGTGYVATEIATAVALAPGESVAFPLVVRNVGTPAFAWTATVQRHTTWSFVGSPISVVLGSGTPSNPNETYPRVGSCSGDNIGSTVVVSGTAETLLGTGRTVTGGGADPICVIVRMLPTASNDNQSKSGVLRIDVTAEQVLP